MHPGMQREVNEARHTRRAFSSFGMAEIVLVLVVLAVIAAVALPRYAEATARYRAEGAMRRLRQDIDLARNASREDGRSRTITLNAVPASYSIVSAAGGTTAGKTVYTVDLSLEPYKSSMWLGRSIGAASITISGAGEYEGSMSLMLAVGRQRAGLVCGTSAAASGGQQVVFGYSSTNMMSDEEFRLVTDPGSTGRNATAGSEWIEIVSGGGVR